VGYGEIADPTPGADEALIEVRAAGTNPIEISMREGHFKATLPFGFPQVMGYDIAGVVASAPTGSAFKAGDEVYARLPNRRLGAYAEHAVVPVGLLARKPRSLSFEEAASLPTVALTTWQAFTERAHHQVGRARANTGRSRGRRRLRNPTREAHGRLCRRDRRSR
jgi:NADPH:quinone reductase-like Zn-dependent oxidoreductase